MLNVKLGYQTILGICFFTSVIFSIQEKAVWGDESQARRNPASLSTITDPNLKNAIANAVSSPLYFPQGSTLIQAGPGRSKNVGRRVIANSPVYATSLPPAMANVHNGNWND